MESTNFLVVQLRQIGDVVLTTPIPRILKEELPGCRVTFLTEAPSDQLLAGSPFIDQVLLNEREGSVTDTLLLGWRLRRRRFDVVLDFMANPRSAVLAFLSGAPRRIAYPTRGRGLLYTDRIAQRGSYAVARKKCLLQPLGVDSAWDRPEIFLDEEEQHAGRALREQLLVGSERRMVTVDPSHRRATRRWPAAHYGALCRLLPERLDAKPVVLWGPGEEELAEQVVATSEGAAALAPPTRLREMAALIGAADLHLGNCSAPRHIAVAVGTPTFTVLGSTSAGWTYPEPQHTHVARGLDCQPCNRNECSRDRVCLTGLEPEHLLAELAAWAGSVLGWEVR